MDSELIIRTRTPASLIQIEVPPIQPTCELVRKVHAHVESCCACRSRKQEREFFECGAMNVPESAKGERAERIKKHGRQ